MDRKKILNYLIGPISSSILVLISLPIITWFYSVEDIGKISMLQVFSSLTTLVFCLGLDQAYVREYHEYKIKPRLFKATFLPGFTLLIIFFSGLYFYDNKILSFWLYEKEDTYLTVISLACLILAFCSRFLSLILRMQERALAYSMSQLLPKVFFLIFILSIVLPGYTTSFNSLAFAHALSIFVVFVVLLWTTRSECLESFQQVVSSDELKGLLKFGLPLVLGGLAVWGMNAMDRLFLRSLSTFSELGVYSVTVNIAAGAAIFSNVFNLIWAPLVYKWVNEKTVCYTKIDNITEHLLAVIFFVLVLSGMLSWLLTLLLPAEYEAVKYLITTCLIAPLFYTLSETTAVGITLARRSSLSMLASCLAMLINLVGNYFLVPLYGAAGAAVATAVAFWFYYVLRTEISRMLWRNIPSKKTYTIITMLLFVTVLNTLYFRGAAEGTAVWVVLFFIGLYIFRKSCHLLLEQIIYKF